MDIQVIDGNVAGMKMSPHQRLVSSPYLGASICDNSNKTVEAESHDSEVDELYRDGTDDASQSYDELASPKGLLRLSGRQLMKPMKNPKSFDSSSDSDEDAYQGRFSLVEDGGPLVAAIEGRGSQL